MSTGHANSAENMLSRLETMALMGGELPLTAIRSQIASALDIVAHLGRLPDRSRKLLSVDEVLGMEEGRIRIETIFHYRRGKGLCFTGHQPENTGVWENYYGAFPRFTQSGSFFLQEPGEGGGKKEEPAAADPPAPGGL